MRRFFLYMLAPSLILLLGVTASVYLPRSTPSSSGDSVSTLDDVKLSNTVMAFFKDTELHLKIPIDRPGVHFRFTMPDAEKRRILDSRRKSDKHPATTPGMFNWRNVKLAIGDGPSRDVMVKIRGKSSAREERKSFNIRLMTAQRINEDFKTRRLFLINLRSDRFGFENHFCYTLLQEMGVFQPYFQFAVVSINDEPQGLYLLVERPKNAIRRTVEGVVSILRKRSGYRAFQKEYQAPGVRIQDILDQFDLAHAIEDHVAQARRYDELIDLDQYMTWLAFNSLILNADSVDELFFYEVRKKPLDLSSGLGQLHITAWDYEDVTKPVRHPDRVHEDPLMYAAENLIDIQITQNPHLYARYRRILKQMLTNHLTEPYLLRTLERTRSILDRIDNGYSKTQQITHRLKRKKKVKKYGKRWIARHKKLLAILDDRADSGKTSAPAVSKG